MGAGQHGGPGIALTEVRQAFELLITQGVTNSEACRVVGINRRTGTRWRYGRDIPATGGRTLHYPPVVTTKRTTPISARFLSEDERVTLADLRRTGATVRAIAAELGGRSPSTVSRELRRNADPAGRYRPLAAHRCAAQRRARHRARRVDRDASLRTRLPQLLALRWSPEQISRALSVEYADHRRRGGGAHTGAPRRDHPGKGSGALKKHVLRFLDQKEIKAQYHPVEKDSRNYGRVFVHFRWK